MPRRRRRSNSAPGSVAEPPPKPFRWDIARREQLGDLASGPEVETYRGFYLDLRAAAAKIFARSGNRELVLVGLSPESIFDYLSGLFHDLALRPTLCSCSQVRRRTFQPSPDSPAGNFTRSCATSSGGGWTRRQESREGGQSASSCAGSGGRARIVIADSRLRRE